MCRYGSSGWISTILLLYLRLCERRVPFPRILLRLSRAIGETYSLNMFQRFLFRLYYNKLNSCLVSLQTEISKRLSAIIVQILPFLSQEHQQQVATAVDRAKQITMSELNSIIGVSALYVTWWYNCPNRAICICKLRISLFYNARMINDRWSFDSLSSPRHPMPRLSPLFGIAVVMHSHRAISADVRAVEIGEIGIRQTRRV